MRKRRIVITGLVLVLCGAPVLAQAQGHPTLDTTGFQQNRDYFSEVPFENIDTLSGGLILTFTDLVLPGNAGRELRFQRTYNSKSGEWRFGIGGVPLFLLHGEEPPFFPPGSEFQAGAPVLMMSDGSNRSMAWAVRPVPGNPATFVEAVSSAFWRYHRPSQKLFMTDGMWCQYEPDPNGVPARRRVDYCQDSFGNLPISRGPNHPQQRSWSSST